MLIIRLNILFILFLLAYLSPWWLLLGGVLLSALFFSKFYEGVLPVIFFDILYRLPTDNWWPVQFSLAIFVLSAIILLEVAKRYLNLKD